MREQYAVRQSQLPPGWREKLALSLFLLALLSPFLVPLALTSDLPAGLRDAVVALLLFGLPMALMLAVVAMTGRPAFAFIKRLAGQDAPPAEVGISRYRAGAALVLVALLVSWVEPLVSPHVAVIEARRVVIGGIADALVLAGLCVLGGQFWDKFHALFVHDATVLPDPLKRRAEAQAVIVTWRFYVGAAMLLCIALAWGLIPIASAAGWSTRQVASLTGGIFIANKVLFIAAVAIMGKDGFNYLKSLVTGVASRFAPAPKVSAGRYTLGLVLVLVPMLMTWIAPYVTGLVTPGSVYGFLQHLSLEALLLVGLFMLGGEFWGKLRALFMHGARVRIPSRLQG